MSSLVSSYKLPPVKPAQQAGPRLSSLSRRRHSHTGVLPQLEATPPPSARRSPPGVRRRASHAQWRHAESAAHIVSHTAPVSRECSAHVSRECSPRPSGDHLQIPHFSSESTTASSSIVLHTSTKVFTSSSASRSEVSTSGSTTQWSTAEWSDFNGDASSTPACSRRTSLVSEQSTAVPCEQNAGSSGVTMTMDDADKSLASQAAPHPPLTPAPHREAGLSQLLLRRFKDSHSKEPLVVETTQQKKSIRPLGETKIYDLYSWEHVLQEDGDGGKVVVCRAKGAKDSSPGPGGKELVMKIGKKQHFKSESMQQQFRKVQHRLLNLHSHPGVMPLLEVFEDQNCYYTVMEKADGGPLFQSLVDEFPNGVIPANVIKNVMRQILDGLGYVHARGLLHRDIKPDNVVVHNGIATLIDFDHADPDWNALEPKQIGYVFGTVRYSAPEAFRGYFSQQSDLYSVGVLLYLLMTGKLPRDDNLLSLATTAGGQHWTEEIYANLRQDHSIDWKCDPWPANPACKSFCQQLLHFLPTSRPNSAEDALAHQWLTDEAEN